MRRILIIIVIVVFTVIATVYYFSKSDKSFFKETSLYQAIPVSVPLFVELNSIKTIPFDSPVFERWDDVKELSDFNYWMTNLDSIIRENSDIQNAIRSNRVVVALGLMGDNQLTPLIIQKAESNNRKKSIANLVKVLFPANEFEYSEFNYAGHKIVSAKTIDNRKSINYCFASGLLIASTNLVLVQQSILQLNDPGIINNSSFKRLTETFTSEPDIAFFINHKLFPDVLLENINSSSLSEVNEFGESVKRNHYRNIRDFKKYASWSELEARFDEHDIIMEGLTIASDTTNDFLAVFEKQEARKSGAGEILTADISFYTSYSFSNKSLFFKNLENYFAHGGSFYKREDGIRNIESGLRIDFKETFQRLVKSEIIVATGKIPKDKGEITNYFILDVEGKSKSENLLDSVLNNYAKRKDIQAQDFKSELAVNELNNFEIIKFPYPSFPGIWLGKPFNFIRAEYAVFYGGYLVFCNSQDGLKSYLSNKVNENRLAENYRYQRATGNLNSRANISTFINFETGINFSDELLNLRVNRKLKKKQDVLQRIHGLVWNVSEAKTGFANEIIMVFDDGKSEEELLINPGSTVKGGNSTAQNVGWHTNIGKPYITKPVLTTNHSDKNNREIVVQDKSNELYQISSEGKINWSFEVGEPILSEIFQVDYLANGKLQYLFNTKSKLFLVDRNGKNIEGFPVNFASEATAGVNVFDYDNKRQYRYFVPCRDKKIAVYDYKGKPVSGWTFGGTGSEVTTPVEHYRIKGKDYIVFKDEQTVYIQNRRGEDLAKVNIENGNSENPIVLNPITKNEIIITDEKGKIHIIGFDGSTREINAGKFDDDHLFTVADLNGDKNLEFIFIDGKKLSVVYEKGNEKFSKRFKGNIKHRPNIYHFGANNKKIGITDSRAGKIFLLDINGQNHSGFPLNGATEFSIGKVKRTSKKLNLLVGSKNGVLTNYRLD